MPDRSSTKRSFNEAAWLERATTSLVVGLHLPVLGEGGYSPGYSEVGLLGLRVRAGRRLVRMSRVLSFFAASSILCLVTFVFSIIALTSSRSLRLLSLG